MRPPPRARPTTTKQVAQTSPSTRLDIADVANDRHATMELSGCEARRPHLALPAPGSRHYRPLTVDHQIRLGREYALFTICVVVHSLGVTSVRLDAFRVLADRGRVDQHCRRRDCAITTPHAPPLTNLWATPAQAAAATTKSASLLIGSVQPNGERTVALCLGSVASVSSPSPSCRCARGGGVSGASGPPRQLRQALLDQTNKRTTSPFHLSPKGNPRRETHVVIRPQGRARPVAPMVTPHRVRLRAPFDLVLVRRRALKNRRARWISTMAEAAPTQVK